MSGSHILEATTEQYGKQIEELREEVERLDKANSILASKVEMIKGAVHTAKLLGTPFCPLIGTIEQILQGTDK